MDHLSTDADEAAILVHILAWSAGTMAHCATQTHTKCRRVENGDYGEVAWLKMLPLRFDGLRDEKLVGGSL